MNFPGQGSRHSPGTVQRGELFGFLGIATVLAIPLTCPGIAYYRRYVLPYMEASAGPIRRPASLP